MITKDEQLNWLARLRHEKSVALAQWNDISAIQNLSMVDPSTVSTMYAQVHHDLMVIDSIINLVGCSDHNYVRDSVPINTSVDELVSDAEIIDDIDYNDYNEEGLNEGM